MKTIIFKQYQINYCTNQTIEEFSGSVDNINFTASNSNDGLKVIPEIFTATIVSAIQKLKDYLKVNSQVFTCDIPIIIYDLKEIMDENESSFWVAAPSGWVDPKAKKAIYNPETGYYEVKIEDEILGFLGRNGRPFGSSYWHIRKVQSSNRFPASVMIGKGE